MRVAFIGTGGIARSHAPGLAKRNDITFVGTYDAVPERSAAFAKDFGGDAYPSIAELLDQAKPDAAWVCLPPFAHGEAELALAKRRIPFMVEKPISNNMDTARVILNAVEQSGILAVAGYMTRYRRSVKRVREILANDPPILLHGGWVGGTPGVMWWRIKEQSGGQIVEQTTHTFDLARYLAGEPKLVYAIGARGFIKDLPHYDVEDASSVTVQFANGAVGTLVSTCASQAGGGVHLTLAARNAYITFTGWEQSAVIRKSALEEERITGESNIFEIEDGAFIEAVKTGNLKLVLSPYSDAIKTLAFCLAANKSLGTGQPVPVESI
ncbi:MAG: Gfo/Idh/MocA family oxidoreductase [Chloroflexi bacterium]|nr:Gfo/Idh/MocA family oxidoreductase [Chloroflexota bacterium]